MCYLFNLAKSKILKNLVRFVKIVIYILVNHRQNCTSLYIYRLGGVFLTKHKVKDATQQDLGWMEDRDNSTIYIKIYG